MTRILAVDDSALMRRLLGDVFSAEPDLQVAFARDGLEAIAQLHAFQPDVVTLDIHMPRLDGLACLDRIMVERPTRVLMVSALSAAGADVTLEAMQRGAVDFIAKPHGAISLAIDAWGPALVAKVREAAGLRLRHSLRLAERVRLRLGPVATRPRRAVAGAEPPERGAAPSGPRASRYGGEQGAGMVLVGASTGGPPALDTLLGQLPADFCWPVLIAQHMPASFTGPLARRLDRLCALRVVEVAQAMPIEPGTVYVARGDADLIVSLRAGEPVAMAAPPLSEHRWHPSVDRMVDTAMQHRDPRGLVGVLMTGMGKDGAESMTRLRAAGGRTIAEAEETAVVWGMPGELVRAGGAEAVLRLERIAERLLRWAL